MIHLKKVNEVANWKNVWNDFVSTCAVDVNICSNPDLRAFFIQYLGYQDFYHFLYMNDELVGLFPGVLIRRKLVCLPHFSYNGLLLRKDLSHQVFINELLKSESLGLKTYEVRSLYTVGAFSSTEKVTSWLSLKDSSEKVIASFKSKLRSQIKKGYKNGLTTFSGGRGVLNDFYEVYARNMHQLGSPVLPRRFFEALFEFVDKGEIEIHLVKMQNVVVGAGFVISYMGFSEVCWASTLRQYNRLNTNMVLYWSMIENAAENGKRIFSFGRSSRDSSTLKFKKQWGAEERQLYFGLHEEKTIEIKKADFLAKLWMKLPYRVTTLIGPSIAKRIY